MALDGSKISKLGFGCMRIEGREDDTIDIEQVSKMVDACMDVGCNYFGTV